MSQQLRCLAPGCAVPALAGTNFYAGCFGEFQNRAAPRSAATPWPAVLFLVTAAAMIVLLVAGSAGLLETGLTRAVQTSGIPPAAACTPPTEYESLVVILYWHDGKLKSRCAYAGSRGTYGKPAPKALKL